jgi:hypothetical protein
MKKRGKRGQFYLVAAVVIVMILVGMAGVRTYANAKPEPRQIQDISSELNEEGARIIDYGIYSRENLTRILNNFSDEEFAPYFLKKTEATNIVLVYGNSSDLYSVQYNPSYTGSVYATIGGIAPSWQSSTIIPNRTKVDTSTGEVEIEVLEKNFKFKVRENEMFYFIISQEKDDEIYIEKND